MVPPLAIAVTSEPSCRGVMEMPSPKEHILPTPPSLPKRSPLSNPPTPRQKFPLRKNPPPVRPRCDNRPAHRGHTYGHNEQPFRTQAGGQALRSKHCSSVRAPWSNSCDNARRDEPQSPL